MNALALQTYRLGKRFGTPVNARMVESRESGADHDVFEVTWSAPV